MEWLHIMNVYAFDVRLYSMKMRATYCHKFWWIEFKKWSKADKLEAHSISKWENNLAKKDN